MLHFMKMCFPANPHESLTLIRKLKRLLLRTIKTSGGMDKRLRNLDVVNMLGQKSHLVLTL